MSWVGKSVSLEEGETPLQERIDPEEQSLQSSVETEEEEAESSTADEEEGELGETPSWMWGPRGERQNDQKRREEEPQRETGRPGLEGIDIRDNEQNTLEPVCCEAEDVPGEEQNAQGSIYLDSGTELEPEEETQELSGDSEKQEAKLPRRSERKSKPVMKLT
ncbi:UNVERIFIED_CONTAM: hypothetical protein FKN15_035301 [Acipenser sinensis]